MCTNTKIKRKKYLFTKLSTKQQDCECFVLIAYKNLIKINSKKHLLKYK